MPRIEKSEPITPIEEVVNTQDSIAAATGSKRLIRIAETEPGGRVAFPGITYVTESTVAPMMLPDEVDEERPTQAKLDERLDPQSFLTTLLQVQRTDSRITGEASHFTNTKNAINNYQTTQEFNDDFLAASSVAALSLPDAEFSAGYTRKIFSHVSSSFLREQSNSIEAEVLDPQRMRRFFNRLSTPESPILNKPLQVKNEQDVYLPDSLVVGMVDNKPTVLFIVEHGLGRDDEMLLHQRKNFEQLKKRFPEFFDFAYLLTVLPAENTSKHPSIVQVDDISAELHVPIDMKILNNSVSSITNIYRMIDEVATKPKQDERELEQSATLQEMRDAIRRDTDQVVIVFRDEEPVTQKSHELHFPHEVFDEIKDYVKGESNLAFILRTFSMYKDAARYGFAYHTGQSLPLWTADAKIRRHITVNPERGADILQDKLYFSETIRGMGYRTPASVLVTLLNVNREDIKSRIDALDTENERRFCKPLGGGRGNGIYVAATTTDALAFVEEQQAMYAVQTVEAPVQDWRYILLRNKEEARNGEQPSWRIAYEKVRPNVMGDSHSTIKQLVEMNTDIPPYAKKKYFSHAGKTHATDVPPEGELVQLIESGNISQGAYGRLPEDTELKNMDKFMLQFLTDLEESIGTNLGTFCVDIGITDPEVLKEPYDFEKMKQEIVFYEFQVPFGFSGYLRNIPPSEVKGLLAQVLPDSLVKRLRRISIGSAVIKAATTTGGNLL